MQSIEFLLIKRHTSEFFQVKSVISYALNQSGKNSS